MKLGIENLIDNSELRKRLKNKRLGLVAHPASVTSSLIHSAIALPAAGIPIAAAFGPQHGIRGEKQYNMEENQDEMKSEFSFPVWSLYGKTRRPSEESLRDLDIVLFDLQDVGTRVYTFLTTMKYMMEACAKFKKELWILDRPNPAGRTVEGTILEKDFESFVGAGPLPMRHGLTLGEAALWMRDHFKLDVQLEVVKNLDYSPNKKGEWGWPSEMPWVNPSPSVPNLSMVRAYPGTVMLEGTWLSEGRGTTHPLELVGHPEFKTKDVIKKMHQIAPEWMKSCILRECYFEPTFDKHAKKLCAGFQIHLDIPRFNPEEFKPYRLMAACFKAVKQLQPDFELWRDFHYEYEKDRLAIDLITGSEILRKWVDDPSATPSDLEKLLNQDESAWAKQSKWIY